MTPRRRRQFAFGLPTWFVVAVAAGALWTLWHARICYVELRTNDRFFVALSFVENREYDDSVRLRKCGLYSDDEVNALIAEKVRIADIVENQDELKTHQTVAEILGIRLGPIAGQGNR